MIFFMSLPFVHILLFDLRISFFVYHLHRFLFFVLDMGYTSFIGAFFYFAMNSGMRVN